MNAAGLEGGGKKSLASTALLSTPVSSGSEGGDERGGVSLSGLATGDERTEFTYHGIFCLFRVITATAFCALESVHGLPVYLVVLIMGVVSFLIDVCPPPQPLAPRHGRPGIQPAPPAERLCRGCPARERQVCISLDGAIEVLKHMPWELFSFVTGFLVLAEAMSITGQHRRLYWASMPNGPACAVGQHAQWASMLMGQHAQWASMPNGPACR